MKKTYKDFIGIYDDAFSKEWCDKVIKHFDFAAENRLTMRRDEEDLQDDQLFWRDGYRDSDDTYIMSMHRDIREYFNENTSKLLQDYATQYDILLKASAFDMHDIKTQKTTPGEAFHRWHYEADTRFTSPRFLTIMIYLNDVDEGGHTEFKYQKVKVKPKKGKLVIWPAGFTHTHKGYPPTKGNKYIITTWLEFL